MKTPPKGISAPWGGEEVNNDEFLDACPGGWTLSECAPRVGQSASLRSEVQGRLIESLGGFR